MYNKQFLKHFFHGLCILLFLFSLHAFITCPNTYAREADDSIEDAEKGVHIDTAFKLGEGKLGIYSYKHLNSVGGLISTILPNVYVIAGVIIFFFILLGGFTIITSAGNPEKQKAGGQILTGALVGFAVIFGAYWIVQLIGLIFMGNANAIFDGQGL